ncbi:MAG: Permuted papain-like amidase enzyme YaeF/YiiX, family, partial [Pseudomonadota bacterium]
PNTRHPSAERFVGDALQNFKEKWTEFKRYFEELKQIPVKQQNARVKWSKLHEEISYTINLISAEPAEKEKLRREILQTFRSTAAPWEHSYRHDGVEIRQGDIILLQTGPVGGLWETLTQSGSLLSHLMMVHFSDEGIPMTVEMNYGQLLVAPLDLYSDRYTIIRPTGLTSDDRKAIYEAISQMIESDYRYDFKFELNSADKLYCSELVAAVFNKAGLARTFQTFSPLSPQAVSIFSAAGIRTRNFYTQGSYIAGLGFSTHADRLNSDPRDYIRGLLVLDGFSKYISEATSVNLYRHPEAHQLHALATLAQTVTPGVRRALGPPRFLYTALVLDKLINIIEEDARRAQVREPSPSATDSSSRIVELKRVINRSLEKALPIHLSDIFPQAEHTSANAAR